MENTKSLDEYLDDAPITAKEFAAMIGIHHVSLSRIRNRSRGASIALAAKIVEASGGVVDFRSLVGVPTNG